MLVVDRVTQVHRRGMIAFELRPIWTGKQAVTFVTDRAPTHVAVDQYSIWVDQGDKDNVAEVEAAVNGPPLRH